MVLRRLGQSLGRLAAAASEYIRRRAMSSTSEGSQRAARERIAEDVRTFADKRTGAPPLPPRPITGNAPTGDDELYDDVQLLGRDASYAPEEWQALQAKMRLVDSSNVYAYAYMPETNRSGTLYVQFLDWTPAKLGGSGERSGPGPTYAYYDVPLARYKDFEGMAASTAGGAVWEYLRVRGSMFEHQYNYRLVQVSGDYVPRKASAGGYKARNTAGMGVGVRRQKGEAARLQLPPEAIAFRRVIEPRKRTFDRGKLEDGRRPPNRGEPNRGRPNRG